MKLCSLLCIALLLPLPLAAQTTNADSTDAPGIPAGIWTGMGLGLSQLSMQIGGRFGYLGGRFGFSLNGAFSTPPNLKEGDPPGPYTLDSLRGPAAGFDVLGFYDVLGPAATFVSVGYYTRYISIYKRPEIPGTLYEHPGTSESAIGLGGGIHFFFPDFMNIGGGYHNVLGVFVVGGAVF